MIRKAVCMTGRDAAKLATLFEGLAFGRALTVNVDLKGEQKRDDRRADLALLRALEQISDPQPDAPKIHGNIAPRTFRAGETLALTQADVDRLEKYVNRAPWDLSRVADVEEALDWLSAAEKIDG